MPSSGPPRVSVIIPSLRADVADVRASVAEQRFADYDVRVVSGVRPAARARNLGVAATTAELLLFIDDDAQMGHAEVLGRLVATLIGDPSIGVVGPSKLLSSRATALQHRIADEVPGWTYPVTAGDVESNPPLDHYGFSGITTTCCVMRRSTFEEVGGFDERLPTGEDTELFYRIRKAGYRFVIPHDTWVYHDPPRSLVALARKSFGYGRGHATEARLGPERRMSVLPLHRWYGWLAVVAAPLFMGASLFVSIYLERSPRLRVGFRPTKAISSYAAFYGYIYGWMRYGR